jgi:parallel beta-helix repeat protein
MPSWSQRQIHHLTLGLLVCCVLGLAHDRATAATFCVSTAADLATSLLTAESNGEDDLIHVIQGTYAGRFIYSATEEHRLTIEGGYLAGCASRVVDPANTVLDGLGTGPVLGLASARSADFVVDGFTIQNGSTTGAIGAGFVISSNGGEQRISHTSVLNNTAGGNRGAGIVVLNATMVALSDNVVSNNSFTGCCDTNAGGMAIFATTVNLTNNTVSNNAHFGCCDGSGGVFIAATLVTLANNTLEGNSLSCCAGGASA